MEKFGLKTETGMLDISHLNTTLSLTAFQS